MKHLAGLTAMVLLSAVVSAHALARPALGIICSTYDTDLKFEFIINQFTGDLFPDTLKISENGKQLPTTTVKQYSYYRDSMLIIASIGPQDPNDDVGYIIELDKSYNDTFSGHITKYISNPPGTREDQTDSYASVDCENVTSSVR